MIVSVALPARLPPLICSEPVEPGYEGARDGTYSPLSRPLFLYVNKASADRPEVDRFVTFLLDNAPALALYESLGFQPIDQSTLYRLQS